MRGSGGHCRGRAARALGWPESSHHTTGVTRAPGTLVAAPLIEGTITLTQGSLVTLG